MNNSKNVFKKITAEELENAKRKNTNVNTIKSSQQWIKKFNDYIRDEGEYVEDDWYKTEDSKQYFLTSLECSSCPFEDGNQFKAESLKTGLRTLTRAITAELPRDVVNFRTDLIL
ncbi:hypothetical protein MIR68_004695 [Amoeboaphelidium protococcarum]|nr:hypothetical protein MIR68_004695 [Amoeboaphelidium protococcarum]